VVCSRRFLSDSARNVAQLAISSNKQVFSRAPSGLGANFEPRGADFDQTAPKAVGVFSLIAFPGTARLSSCRQAFTWREATISSSDWRADHATINAIEINRLDPGSLL
jgi:hypothetical protein